MRVLVTGAVGFIGFHVCRRLLADGDEVVGVDNLNDYYDPNLKKARLEALEKEPDARRFEFVKLDLKENAAVAELFERKFDAVCHLSAQPGVRYSLIDPHAYVQNNVSAFLNVLEGCRHHRVGHLVYASSSSVYGLNQSMPYRTCDNVDHPISLYAATKKSDELMAHTYSHLYGIPTTGLRFFTVYGPWGRPDMAPFLFTRAILEGKPIDIYNHGRMERDFTYVDDIVEGVVRVLRKPPEGRSAWDAKEPDPSSSPAPYRLYNIGRGEPIKLLDFIEALEDALGMEAQKNLMPIQPGDVERTWADTSDLEREFGYRPQTPLREGIKKFVDWYRAYYGV